MKKWLLSLFMVLALIACKDEKKEQTQVTAKQVKIGIILPFTEVMNLKTKECIIKIIAAI